MGGYLNYMYVFACGNCMAKTYCVLPSIGQLTMPQFIFFCQIYVCNGTNKRIQHTELVVQIWTIIFVEYFVSIDQKIGQKIQVKAKFPQAVITNTRTLPLVFPKMFWTAAWRETPDGCFWHFLCKTIYLRSKKVALTVFTEMYSTPSFMEIKMLL